MHAVSYIFASVLVFYGWYTTDMHVYSAMLTGTRHTIRTSLTQRTSPTSRGIVSFCAIATAAVSLEMSYVSLTAAICVSLYLCHCRQTT